MTETTLEDLKAMLKGDYAKPVMHVRDEEDPLYITIKRIVKAVDPDIEDYMHNINARFASMLEGMSSMESHDISSIINTFKKYEVKGNGMGGVSGKRMYGYDKSRVDRKMIRRRRPN